MNPLTTIAAANPWLGLAAQLAASGLPKLAERVRKQPGSVAREIGAALNVPPAPGKLEAALASDPEAIDKLAVLDLEVFAAEEESRQTARTAWRGTWVMGFTALFAFTVLMIFAGVLYTLAKNKLEPENLDAFAGQLKVLEYLLISAASFFLGSSVGSKLKGPIDGQK